MRDHDRKDAICRMLWSDHARSEAKEKEKGKSKKRERAHAGSQSVWRRGHGRFVSLMLKATQRKEEKEGRYSSKVKKTRCFGAGLHLE